MRRLILVAMLMSTAAVAQTATAVSAPPSDVTSLLSRDLQGIPGKEGTMLLIEYPPGGADPVHRHHATVFVFVLEGTVVMQVRGGKEVTLTAGQTFSEGPDDLHLVGRNASTTQPARFLAFFVKDKGAPAVMPVTEH